MYFNVIAKIQMVVFVLFHFEMKMSQVIVIVWKKLNSSKKNCKSFDSHKFKFYIKTPLNSIVIPICFRIYFCFFLICRNICNFDNDLISILNNTD